MYGFFESASNDLLTWLHAEATVNWFRRMLRRSVAPFGQEGVVDVSAEACEHGQLVRGSDWEVGAKGVGGGVPSRGDLRSLGWIVRCHKWHARGSPKLKGRSILVPEGQAWDVPEDQRKADPGRGCSYQRHRCPQRVCCHLRVEAPSTPGDKSLLQEGRPDPEARGHAGM